MAQLHFGAGHSISTGTTGSAVSNVASFSKSDLSNVQVGDMLIAWIHSQNPNSATVTPPSGWMLAGPAAGTPNYSNSRLSGVYYYPVKTQLDLDNLPATITWTFSLTARIASHIVRATGIDLDNPVDTASSQFPGGGTTTSISIASISTSYTNTLLIGVLAHQNSASTTSPSTTAFMTNFQEYKTAPTGSALANTGSAIGYRMQATAGSTGAVNGTYDSQVTAHTGILVAFRTTTSVLPVTHPTIHYTSAPGILSSATIHYTSASDTLATPAEVRPFPSGYSSVTNMLAQDMFYVAHRAGSRDWPEHSLYAYSQAGFWGAGALELSVHRTSDGVWFGLHDATLDRTSGTTGFIPSEHTWAEVQMHMISAATTTDPGQPDRPYARWEEIMDAYYDSHVFFVDPKEDWQYSNELLDMMDAMPGNPKERFIAKAYGPGANPMSGVGWVYEARQRGYKVWGYFYEVDSPTNIANCQGVYDLLGMEYSANQTAWNDIKSYGKPVVGHIVSSATAADTAITKGADGLMVSGVKSVIPRFEY